MEYVKQMKICPDARASEIIAAMRSSGVLGGGRLAKAAELVKEFFEDPDFTIFLAMAGPVVPGGLGAIVSELVRKGHIDALVSNGANLTHDIIEGLGFRHIRGDARADDSALRRRGIGRIGDIYTDQAAFKQLERWVHRTLETLAAGKEGGVGKVPVSTILEAFGRGLKAETSILASAAERGVPIFSPGIFDSMLGLHLWTYGQLNALQVDLQSDMSRMADLVYGAKKIGAIILGGGVPKHFTLGACMLRGGADAAVQIIMDRPEGGSLSGASLEEAISWGKAKEEGNLVTVVADFTIAFPLIIAYATSGRV
ncbi:MAG: deoxyhypusine synthase [Candidatus Bathyarchaeia archaeon]